MPKDLLEAREFAYQVRFSGDTLEQSSEAKQARPDALKNLFYCNELCISAEVTPGLFASLEEVRTRLGIPADHIVAFVYASPDLNAHCFAGDHSECIIRVSSALIDILNKEEFEFVIGHELGHFLLSHSTARADNTNESIEFFMQQRAQEISADRLGLIACNSLDVAVKALMKTVSGLNDVHLRFNIGAFISQLNKTRDLVTEDYQSTHPSMLVRCKALLWFSLNDSFRNNQNKYSKEELEGLDQRIKNDLDKYVDSSARRKIDDSKNDLSMWMAALDIVQDSKFSKKEQHKFGELFGKDRLDRLIGFLNDFPASEIKERVAAKLEDARNELESLIPHSFENELKTLIKWNSDH